MKTRPDQRDANETQTLDRLRRLLGEATEEVNCLTRGDAGFGNCTNWRDVLPALQFVNQYRQTKGLAPIALPDPDVDWLDMDKPGLVKRFAECEERVWAIAKEHGIPDKAIADISKIIIYHDALDRNKGRVR